MLLKPVKVNEFEFQKDSSEYAKISIKINNSIKEVSFDRDYVIGINSEDIEVKTPIRCTINDSVFLTFLKEQDIEIDFTDLKEEYKKLSVEREEHLKELKIKKLKAAYDNSIVHKLIKEIEILYPEVKASVDPFNPECRPFLHLIYKEVSIKVACSTGNCEDSFEIWDSLTSYKIRRFKKLKSLIKSFKELVNLKINKEEREIIEKTEKEKEKEDIVKKLRKITGKPIESTEEYYKSPYNRHSQGYTTTVYVMLVKDQKINVSLLKSDYRLETEDLIQIAGLKVNFLQAKEIIAILDQKSL